MNKSILSSLFFALCSVVLCKSIVADSDIEVTRFIVVPQEWVETLSPEGVSFDIRNNGPDDWKQEEGEAPRNLLLHFWVSDDEALSEDDQLLVTFNAPLELAVDEEQRLNLFGIHRSALILPSRPEPYYWFFQIEADGFTDPDDTNNSFAAENPTIITPAKGEIYATFSGPEIISQNMTVEPFDCFVFNEYYGNNWRIQCNEGDTGFTATFESEEAKEYRMIVTHLTSYSQACPGDGYSPVSIRVNGEDLVTEYDPAENHDGDHWYVTDTWVIQAQEGVNTLEWFGEQTCTHYWMQQIEIAPVLLEVGMSLMTSDGSGELQFICPENAILTVETSTNLKDWELYKTVENTQSTELINIGEMKGDTSRYFRATAHR